MWLKYQQVNAKMASFDPREIMKGRDTSEVAKLPLKRFEPTLRTSLRVVIPMNLDRLKKHKTNIEKYAYSRKWKELNIEQINATRTVQQLQATIRDLDKIKTQIQDADLREFEKCITPMKQDSFKAIQEFTLLHELVSQEVQKSINDEEHMESTLVNKTDHEICPNKNNGMLTLKENIKQTKGTEQIQETEQLKKDELAACQSWDQLQNGLVELNNIIQDFATVVHHQQECVDRIEDNVEVAHENVHTATGYLAQASKYKTVMIPVAGAVIGGIIGGPIGLLAGFKLAGVAAAVSGGVAGYQGGKYMKRKHDERVDMELSNLSTPNSTEINNQQKDG